MKLVYVAGPYTALSPTGIKQNILNAEKHSIELIREGWAVITPHKNTSGYEAYGLAEQIYYDMDLEILKRCDAIAMIPGWEKSKGARLEYERAKEWGKEILYL